MKSLKIISALLITALAFSCNQYRKITLGKTDFYKKKRIVENVDRYDFIVHDEDSVYLLKNAEMDENKLSGNLKAIEAEPISEDNNKNIDPDSKNDIHIYLDKDTDVSDISDGDVTELTESSIEKAEMYAKDDMGVAGVFLTVFLILGILAAIILIVLLAAISSASGGGSSSDSGGSDSGGSDSGGSSCYVATMAYGSQDARQVVMLRQFRDRFLVKTQLGRSFITWYYANSPAFVEKHKSKTWLHTFIRVLLNGFVGFISLFLRK